MRNRLMTDIPELDKALGGGFPIGRLVHLYGSSSVGKSTLVYNILGKTSNFSCLIDTESCFDPIYASHLGVQLHRLMIVNIKDYSKVFDYLEVIVREGVFRYIVVDSIAGIASEKIYQLIQDKLPGILKELIQHDTVLIFTNQVRGKGKKTKAAHGLFINSMASVILEIKGKHKTKEGFESTVDVIKNKHGFYLGELKLKLGDK